MLTMPEINSIKYLRNDKSLSINKIADIHKINWRTAKKYADGEQIPKEEVKGKKGMMYEEKWGEIVSDWLLEDQKLKRKSRRTNKTLFGDLQEMGFPGSYRSLCNFVQEWRGSRNHTEGKEHDKNYERLSHPPAEAQIEFGLMESVKDGKYIDVHCLVMMWSFSNSAFVVPLTGENQECLFYGMKRIFNQLGCVPKKIRIDNMKTAVVKPRKMVQKLYLPMNLFSFQTFLVLNGQLPI